MALERKAIRNCAWFCFILGIWVLNQNKSFINLQSSNPRVYMHSKLKKKKKIWSKKKWFKPVGRLNWSKCKINRKEWVALSWLWLKLWRFRVSDGVREKNVKIFDERECKNENDKGKIKMGGLRKIMGELMWVSGLGMCNCPTELTRLASNTTRCGEWFGRLTHFDYLHARSGEQTYSPREWWQFWIFGFLFGSCFRWFDVCTWS